MSDARPIWKTPPNFNEINRKPIKHNFPWDTLEKDECFPVSFNEMKLKTLRAAASTKGKKLNKKFKVITCDDYYLVGRLA